VLLHAIATRGSLWAAADALDLSQSAVSQQLASLEEIVGQRLVERYRGKRQTRLTEAGELLLRHAEAIVARLTAARADFAALESGASGSLKVGTFQSVGAHVIPALLLEFALDWPGVEVELVEQESYEQLLVALEHGEVDLSFAMYPLPDGPFEATELLQDPYVLVVPVSSPIGAGQLASLEALRGVPLIGLRSPVVRGVVAEALRQRGLDPRVVMRTDDNGTLQGLVAAGIGVAIAPLLAVDVQDPRVRVIHLADLPSRRIVMAWHRDRYRSPAARAFVLAALRVCARLGRPAGRAGLAGYDEWGGSIRGALAAAARKEEP